MANLPIDVNHCTMYIEECEDFYCDDDKIQFIIKFNTYAKNKITLLHSDNTNGFNNPHIFNIPPSKVYHDFNHLISGFKNDNDSYTLPYGIMLKIMERYDKVMYDRYVKYYNPEHDDDIIDYHINALHQRYQQLLTLKMVKND